jgi:serine/threonine protein kinase
VNLLILFVNIKDPYWKDITDEAKDLINHLLVVDASKRYTAKDALNHPWLSGKNTETNLPNTLTQLKKFNAKKKWKVRNLHASSIEMLSI